MRTFLCSGALGKLLPVAALAGALVAGGYAWRTAAAQGSGHRVVSGMGSIEGNEITVAATLTGRVENILVKEGQFVRAGQVLGRMQVQSLLAERDEAYARYRHAHYAAATAETALVLRKSEITAAEAARRQRDGEFESVVQALGSALANAQEGASREQDLEELRAAGRRAAAAASAADAHWGTTTVAVHLARVQLASARSAIAAAEATIRRVETQLADMELKAPRDAVVQHRLADRGEMLTTGAPILSLLDASDISLTFLAPEAVCRRLAPGSEARVALDGAPDSVIPATVSFVGRVAPPKRAMGSMSAGGDLTCRVKAQLDRELVQEHPDRVTMGASGVGWVKLDPQVPWPPALAVSW